MDDAMRRRLLDEQFNVWLREKMQAVDAVFDHANSADSAPVPEKDEHTAEATETPPTQGNDASLPGNTQNLQDPWDESATSSAATEPSPT